MSRRVSLRTELVVFCIGIVVITTVIQILGNVLFSQKIAIAQKENQVEELYTTLVSEYTDEPQALYDLLESYQEEQNIRVYIESETEIIYSTDNIQVNEQGEVLYGDRFPNIFENVSTSRDDFINRQQRPDGEEGVLAEEMPEDLLEGAAQSMGLGVAPATNPVETDQIVVQLTDSFLYEGEVRTVAIWSSVAALEESVTLYTRINIAVSIAVLLLGVLVIFFLSRRITTPIVAVDGVAKKMAKGDFSSRAKEDIPTKELSSLAESINTMSDSLQQMIATLEQDNRSLTVEVEDQQKLEQMRRQFIANISHEMKTPLALLMMYSESLKLDIPGVDKTFYYDTIIEEAQGLNDMVAQLLDISSLENGLSALALAPLHLSALVKETAEKFVPLLAPYQFHAQVEEDIWIEGERKYLVQAINNYLNNAVSHTVEGKQISLALEKRQGQAVLTIFNQGAHIAGEDMPHLWDSFYRGDKQRAASSEKRIGLGLYLVKTAIGAHGGQVFVENRLDGVAFSFAIDTIAEPNV